MVTADLLGRDDAPAVLVAAAVPEDDGVVFGELRVELRGSLLRCAGDLVRSPYSRIRFRRCHRPVHEHPNLDQLKPRSGCVHVSRALYLPRVGGSDAHACTAHA